MLAQIDIPWAELGGIGLLSAVLLYVILASFKAISEARAAFLTHVEKQGEREDKRSAVLAEAMEANTKATQELKEAVKDLAREVRTNGRGRRSE